MPALDLGRGWRAFRAVENDAQGVAIDADNFKDRMRDRRLRDLRGFWNHHDLLKIKTAPPGGI